MTKEKKKIELTEDQLAKLAGGEHYTYTEGSTECPNCHKQADCLISLTDWVIGDIRCYHCGYGIWL